MKVDGREYELPDVLLEHMYKTDCQFHELKTAHESALKILSTISSNKDWEASRIRSLVSSWFVLTGTDTYV